jgi:hypothetical protein
VGALGPLLRSEEGIRLRRDTTSEGTTSSSGGPSLKNSSIWIEAGEKGSVRIVVVDSHGRAVERQINGRDLTPVTAEIVAQIVQDAARALLAEEDGNSAGAAAPTSRSVSPAQAATERPLLPSSETVTIARQEAPTAPDSRDRRFTFVVDVGFTKRLIFDPELVFYGSPSDHTEQGIAGALTVIRHHPIGNAFLSLMVDQTWASTPAFGANVGFPALDITTFSSRVLAGLAWRPARLFQIGVGIGAGADRVHAQAGATGSGSAWLIALRSALRASVLVPRTPLEVWLAFSVDARPRAKFAVSAPPGTMGDTLQYYNTAPIQPGVTLGIGWRL